ncbi:MAG: FG-GAP-like repeat-containing protein, partial [Bacteroidales bacterium]|nr:FG-GAP-like repeat-containing protein [Bacteroidales bacterium]
MKTNFTKILFFTLALLIGFSSSYADTIKIVGMVKLENTAPPIEIFSGFSFEEVEIPEISEENILRIRAGSMLIIGDPETGISGELRVTSNTFLIIEDGANLLVEEGSKLVVEESGGIVIQSGADFAFMGASALILDPCAQFCLQPEVLALPLSVFTPPIHCDIPIRDICDDDRLWPPPPPPPPTDPYPSMVANNDLEYVNTLVGVVGTTPTGALTYTIPITVPVGTAGMQPQLAIVYNSQNNSNGILGVGFGISGLSSISRVGRNFYHDNERTGVTLTMNDHFALDGQRLIQTGGSGAIGTNGVIYDTEMASFADIRSFGHGANGYLGPQRFEVRPKNGGVLHYGLTTDSRTQHTISSQTVVSQWHISRMEDPNGNFIEYLYHTGAGYANQIREIRYGHTSNGIPLNRIVFNYIDKPIQNQRTLYLAGNPIAEQKLLNEIRIYSNNNLLVKRYSFHYTTDRQRLVHMRKFAPNGRILGELRFDWSETQQRFANPVRWTERFRSGSPEYWSDSRHPRTLADMTGDGRVDAVGFAHNGVLVGISNGTGFTSSGYWHQGAFTQGSNWQVDRHPRHVVDVNGDGIADVVGFGQNGVYVGLSNGHNGLSTSYWMHLFGARDGWTTNHHPRHLADFNGDGLPDIIGHGNYRTYVAINTGGNFHGDLIYAPIFRSRSFHFRAGNDGSKSLIGDINGDGRADIVVLSYSETNCGFLGLGTCDHAYTLYFALSNGNSLGASTQTSIKTPYISRNRRHNFFLADVNGDGKTDFIFARSTGLYVALSTGTGFLEPIRWTTSFGTNTNYSTNDRFVLTLTDVNGDGLPDVVAFDGSTVRVALNTGNRFATAIDWTPTSSHWGSNQSRWNNNNNFRTLADVNGDGLPDLIGFDNDGVWVSLNMSGQPMLVGVTDNLGRQFTAEYDFLTNSAIYTKGHAETFPLMSYQGPIRVCTRLTTRSSDKRFSYEGAVIHQQGRGFLGFSSITETNLTLQLRQVSEFEVDTNFFVNLPIRVEVFSTVNNQRLSENIQTNTIRHLGGRRILNEISQTISRDFLTNVEQITRLRYDDFGNILSDTTTRGTIEAQPIARFVTRNTYVATTARNIPNRLATTVSYSYYIATPSQRMSQKRRFAYDSRGNLETIINRYGTPIAKTTRYRINSRGLIYRVETSAPGVSSKVQQFGYDPHFRFQTSQETVGLGRTGQSFDTWGRILTDTAIGGQTTTYQYDAFGRLDTVTSPEGFVATHTIRRERNVSGVVYTSLVQQAGRPDVRTSLDILGRTVRTETYNPSGRIVTITEFNNRGLLSRKSMPHFGNDEPKWTEFRYDKFGRLEYEIFEISSSERLTTIHRHEDLTTFTTDPAGRKTRKTHNAVGDIILVVDAMGGEIHYKYFAPGFVDTIIAPGNAITTIQYDPFGRQIALHDPNAGRIKFGYDALDRIAWQRTARGDTTFNRFDNFGRLEIVTENNRITTYNYFNSGPNIGRLQSISVNNGTAHIFEYDTLGRVVRFTDISENNTFITEYTYDQFGNLLTYTFPSNFKLRYTYDANGFKIEIREYVTGNLIWRLDSVNAFGQELESIVGIDMLNRRRIQTYNVFGQPKRMVVGELVDYNFRPSNPEGIDLPHGTVVSPTLMDFSYSYDLFTGNMRSRKNVFNRTNDILFVYDDLNRLTTGVEFSPCGNIRSKEGVGTFTYDRVRRHAVVEICPPLNKRGNHTIEYTSFQKISEITARDGPIFLHANFVYGPNRQRRQMTVLFGNDVLTKHYTQNFERVYVNGARTETKEYIFSPFGLVAIRNNNVVNAVATDHLGSIVARFNPRAGDYEFFGFTAWGRRYRYENGNKFFFDEKDWSLSGVETTSILDFFARGFTGHEHMDAFGLINMNGRLYDPLIGRFLSPDPFVPDATFTQDFNRYMYAR